MQITHRTPTARGLWLAAALLLGCNGGHEADAGQVSDDAGLTDAALIDAALIDAALIDAGRADAALTDAGRDEDAGPPPSDASVEDAGAEDASSTDASVEDASVVDAGPTCIDADGDGAGVGDGCAIVDCDDDDPSSYPGALELCDLADNDCDGVEDESCVCPLLSAACAAGCCTLVSERVTSGEGNYPDAAVDVDGNLYVAFADPDSLTWRSGLATRTWDSGTFRQVDYAGGSVRSEVRVDESGRVHHMHATNTGPVRYRYSDDRGQTWTEIPGIPGTLRIGGACSMDFDSSRNPHLYCGFDEPAGFTGYPRYLSWDGSSWRSQRLSVNAGGLRTTQMHLDSAGRPQVIHTYGPSATALHHTRYTGSVWITEAVPIAASLQVHGDRYVGFELDDADGIHVFFTARSTSGGDYTGYYAHRSAAGAWTFEEAIPSTVIGAGAPQAYLALQDDGQPVVATGAGAMARRTASGAWVPLTSPDPIQSLVIDGPRALVIFQSSVGMRPLHVAAVGLFP